MTFLITSRLGCGGQVPDDRPPVLNQKFDEEISRTISFSVPTIGVEELKDIQNEVVIFDARKREEYEVSHLPGARYIGYSEFDPEQLKSIPKDREIVLYCSVGYRSEKIGEKLRKLGFTNVKNLYGSIFEWVNQGLPVVDSNEQPTQKLHTYNHNWSKWVDNKEIEKVW